MRQERKAVDHEISSFESPSPVKQKDFEKRMPFKELQENGNFSPKIMN